METKVTNEKKSTMFCKLQNDVRKLLSSGIGTCNTSKLQQAMILLFKKSLVLAELYARKNKIERMKKLTCVLRAFLSHCHFRARFLSKAMSNPTYEELVAAILSVVLKSEIAVVVRNNGRSVHSMKNLIRDFYLFLGHKPCYMWDAVLRSSESCRKQAFLNILFERINDAVPKKISCPDVYLKYLMMVRLWRKNLDSKEEKEKVVSQARKVKLSLKKFFKWINSVPFEFPLFLPPDVDESVMVKKIVCEKMKKKTFRKLTDVLLCNISNPSESNADSDTDVFVKDSTCDSNVVTLGETAACSEESLGDMLLYKELNDAIVEMPRGSSKLKHHAKKRKVKRKSKKEEDQLKSVDSPELQVSENDARVVANDIANGSEPARNRKRQLSSAAEDCQEIYEATCRNKKREKRSTDCNRSLTDVEKNVLTSLVSRDVGSSDHVDISTQVSNDFRCISVPKSKKRKNVETTIESEEPRGEFPHSNKRENRKRKKPKSDVGSTTQSIFKRQGGRIITDQTIRGKTRSLRCRTSALQKLAKSLEFDLAEKGSPTILHAQETILCYSETDSEEARVSNKKAMQIEETFSSMPESISESTFSDTDYSRKSEAFANKGSRKITGSKKKKTVKCVLNSGLTDRPNLCHTEISEDEERNCDEKTLVMSGDVEIEHHLRTQTIISQVEEDEIQEKELQQTECNVPPEIECSSEVQINATIEKICDVNSSNRILSNLDFNSFENVPTSAICISLEEDTGESYSVPNRQETSIHTHNSENSEGGLNMQKTNCEENSAPLHFDDSEKSEKSAGSHEKYCLESMISFEEAFFTFVNSEEAVDGENELNSQDTEKSSVASDTEELEQPSQSLSVVTQTEAFENCGKENVASSAMVTALPDKSADIEPNLNFDSSVDSDADSVATVCLNSVEVEGQDTVPDSQEIDQPLSSKNSCSDNSSEHPVQSDCAVSESLFETATESLNSNAENNSRISIPTFGEKASVNGSIVESFLNSNVGDQNTSEDFMRKSSEMTSFHEIIQDCEVSNLNKVSGSWNNLSPNTSSTPSKGQSLSAGSNKKVTPSIHLNRNLSEQLLELQDVTFADINGLGEVYKVVSSSESTQTQDDTNGQIRDHLRPRVDYPCRKILDFGSGGSLMNTAPVFHNAEQCSEEDDVDSGFGESSRAKLSVDQGCQTVLKSKDIERLAPRITTKCNNRSSGRPKLQKSQTDDSLLSTFRTLKLQSPKLKILDFSSAIGDSNAPEQAEDDDFMIANRCNQRYNLRERLKTPKKYSA